MAVDDVSENEQLDEKADNVINNEKVIPVIKECETIIRSKSKEILNMAYRQRLIFKKFKKSNTLMEMIIIRYDIQVVDLTKIDLSCIDILHI